MIWYLDIQEVIAIGKLMQTGKANFDRSWRWRGMEFRPQVESITAHEPASWRGFS